MFARSADELAGRMVLSEVEGPGNSVPWQGVQGDGVPPALDAPQRTKKRAMFARSADELARPHGSEQKRKVQGTQFPGRGYRGQSPLT